MSPHETPIGLSPAAVTRHQTPSGFLLAAVVLLLLLYIGWRSGRLRSVRNAVRALRLGHRNRALEGIRLRPAALLPTVLLAIVIVLLLLTQR